MNVEILAGRCRRGLGAFGLRLEERADRVWRVTWAFPLDERRLQSEGYGGHTLWGKIDIDRDIPCCPRCRAPSITKCGVCGKITCWDESPTNQCQWCSNGGVVAGQIDSVAAAEDG